MTFDKYMPESDNSQLQQQHLAQFGLDEINQQKNNLNISPKPENQFSILVEKTSALIFVI